MPDETIASAVSLIAFSSTWQPNLPQLFHPIGGVGASPEAACAAAIVAAAFRTPEAYVAVRVNSPIATIRFVTVPRWQPFLDRSPRAPRTNVQRSLGGPEGGC